MDCPSKRNDKSDILVVQLNRSSLFMKSFNFKGHLPAINWALKKSKFLKNQDVEMQEH